MLNRLLKQCHEFYVKAMELDPELAEKVVLETGEGLSDPTTADQIDIQILMTRAAKALNVKNIPHFIKAMVSLDRFVREFKHESFDEDFYDFVVDQDLWDWVHSLENKKLNNQDWALASIVRDNLIELSNEKLFK